LSAESDFGSRLTIYDSLLFFMFLDIPQLVKTAGYVGLFGIVFAETGLFFGFFLPGDSLLFTAGILASQGFLDITLTCVILFVAALIGDNVGYTIGRHAGPRLFTRPKSLLFNPEHLKRSHDFFERHGGKAVIIARFVPVVRTFSPVVSGLAQMNYLKFMFYSVVGALLWAVGLTLLGYWLGTTVPNVEHYIAPGIIIIILLSISPGIYHVLKDKKSRDGVLRLLKLKK
jgi:membrane-associated protein